LEELLPGEIPHVEMEVDGSPARDGDDFYYGIGSIIEVCGTQKAFEYFARDSRFKGESPKSSKWYASMQVKHLIKTIGYFFKNPAHLEIAITANGEKIENPTDQ
jgi:hypothetical protein